MSLFKVKEWWASSAGETDEFDGASWCIAKLFSLETDERDQLVIGGHSGTLWIFDPGNNAEESGSAPAQPFKPEHLLLEQKMDYPIVQVAAGRFVTGAHHHQLAILYPRKLAIYTMRSTESSQVQHGAQHSLSRIYEHLLPRTAFNMVCGPFGGIQDKDYMCVQSLDGTLSFYENENFAFSRFLPGALLPGPLAFVPLADSFLTVSSTWTLESYKYQVLAVAVDSKTKEEAAMMTTGKRVAPDWSFPLGEYAIDLAVLEISPAQPSIIVLGERTVFCFTEGGTLRFMRRLDYSPVCLLAYTATSEGYLQYLVGSDTKTLMLYADTTLIWTAQLAFTPVGLRKTTFGQNLRGYLAALDEMGKVTVSYLGTDPALFGIPQTDVRHVDFAERQKELRRLQQAIKGNTKGFELKRSNKSTDELNVTCQVPTSFDSPSMAYDSEIDNDAIPSVTVRITLTAKVPVDNVQVFVNSPAPIAPHQSSFSFASISGTQEIPVTFFVRRVSVPTSLNAVIYIIYSVVGGPIRVVETSCSLPIKLICKACSASKSATHKITLETNTPTASMVDLFGDFPSDGDAALSMGFHVFGQDSAVSLLSSKSTQKYRAQSENFEGLWLFLAEFVARIRKHYSHSSGFHLSFVSNLPLTEYFALLDHHFELQTRKRKLEAILASRCAQLRAVQAQLLTKFKDTTPTPLAHLDALLEMTHRQVLSIAASIADLQKLLAAKHSALSSATSILLLLLRLHSQMSDAEFDKLKAAFSPVVDEYPEQTWEERVDTAINHLLHILNKGHAAASPASHEMARLPDTTRLKKHIALLCEKIIKGVRLPTSLTTAEVAGQTAPKPSNPTPVPRRAGGRLETIMEDTNATDASEMELGGADVPIGSQFGALQSGTLATTIEVDEETPLDDEFDDQPPTPRQSPPTKLYPTLQSMNGIEDRPATNGTAIGEADD